MNRKEKSLVVVGGILGAIGLGSVVVPDQTNAVLRGASNVAAEVADGIGDGVKAVGRFFDRLDDTDNVPDTKGNKLQTSARIFTFKAPSIKA